MSKRIWTQDQEKAISISKRTVLVSAAAGSGKTASLSERVIRKITSKENPSDVDRLLIVTFTNAAASEMKERISKSLSELAKIHPYDRNLKRQQFLLKHANICTIHSFCNNVVRDNFYKLKISPNFRIADENEISIIQENAMEKTLGEFYDKEDVDFFKVVELFSNEKDDSSFIDIIHSVYDFVQSCPFPDAWFKEKKKLYSEKINISDTVWGKTLIRYVYDTVSCCESLLQKALHLVDGDENLKEFYSDALSEELSAIGFIKSSLKQSWDSIIYSLKKFKKGHRKRIPKEMQNDIYIYKVESVRDYVKKSIDKLKKCFAFQESICRCDIENISLIVSKLFEVTNCFIREMDKIKQEKNIAEFSDLEHWMIKLLVEKTENGKNVKSDTAKDISARFDEIMIDEYQDTNETQDLIFKMISQNERNLFMVGDVKQSIYGFRQAKPEIFLNKKNQYELYDSTEKNSRPCKIILAKNFRSRSGIIDTVNFIFNELMSKESCGIDYGSEEALTSAAQYEKKNEPETVLEIIETQTGDDNDTVEAARIAEIISKMVSEKYMVKDGDAQRPVTYRDFCILLRSANKHANAYVKELNNQGIPAWSDATGKFFGTAEISVILSLLRVVDNPMQDISLLAVLVSPMFGFTPDDLSDIRLKMKDVPLYLALKAQSCANDLRCREFIQKIDNYRKLCSTLSVEKLINYIYDDTGYISVVLAMKNGEIRLANLRLLAEYAGKYDGTAYNGLSGFIGFIDKLQEKKSDLSPASTVSEMSNVVRVMSIHRSKGLEFPVCIIARCSGKFNKTNKKDILLHPELGAGIKLKDETGYIKYSNFVNNAVSIEIEKEEIEEELRVLYVACTRAKEKLIFLLSVKNLEKTIDNNISAIFKDDKIPPYIIRNANSFTDWILNCLFLSRQSEKLYEYIGISDPFGILSDKLNEWEINITKAFDKSQCVPETNTVSDNAMKLPAEIMKRFDYKYPYSEANGIPAKISASKLAQEESWRNYIAVSRPQFMSDLSVSPAERGTAFHEFLHFADYSSSLKDIDSQINYLKEKGFLTSKQAEILDKKHIYAFLRGELGNRIIKSSHVMREYRFTVRIPSSGIGSGKSIGDEKIIVQGAIDCVFKENDGYVIVDYKTDRIKNLSILVQKYSKQLNIYKYAFETCEEVKVKELLIYSLHVGDFIRCPMQNFI